MIMPRGHAQLLLPASPWFIGGSLALALAVQLLPIGRHPAWPDAPSSATSAKGWCASNRLRSTASAEARRAAIHCGPLSTQTRSSSAASSMPRAFSACARSSGSTGPSRRSGGAAKASRAPSRRTRTRPIAHSWTTSPGFFASPPLARKAWALPSVGWPANGNSPLGVKMRTR